MSEIEQKIAVLESKIKRQQITLNIFTVTVLFITLTNFSLTVKISKVINILEELIHVLNLIVN